MNPKKYSLDTSDSFLLLGSVALVIGAYLVYAPFSYLILGAIFCILAFLTAASEGK